jgi:hypothetical protein
MFWGAEQFARTIESSCYSGHLDWIVSDIRRDSYALRSATQGGRGVCPYTNNTVARKM